MIKKIFYPLLASLFICGCSRNNSSQNMEIYPDIFPDYADVTIPVNIAPLNFMMRENYKRIEVHFIHNDRILLKRKGRNRIRIPQRIWRAMLQEVAGSSLSVQVYAKRAGNRYAYKPFSIHVAHDSIDPYIAYRLIDPGYEIWDRMGIYQRNLSNFKESPIILNRLTGKNCMNCHSFHDYNPERMMFHSRSSSAGTFLYADGQQYRLETKTENAASPATYPAWHPSGDYIAFSSNTTRQAFHALPGKKIQVYDLDSDLIIYDVKNGAMIRDPRFTVKETWENFPAWSPDGRWLYFCFAEERNMPFESRQLIYGLCRVDFDPATGLFGTRIDTIETVGKSISFPSLSPDGNFLLYNVTEYAKSIWHNKADLEMIDLRDNSQVDMQRANSEDAESYHAWSSNGRWIVFSSRRIDGWHARLFFAYFDESGKIHKPFLLPQKNPKEDIRFLKAYNIPEFIKGKVNLNPYDIRRTLNGDITNLNEIIIKNE